MVNWGTGEQKALLEQGHKKGKAGRQMSGKRSKRQERQEKQGGKEEAKRGR